MQVIILAAGEGKRISSLTNGTHKSLLPIDSNETFLSRLLHQLNEYEINRLVVVTGYKSESVKSAVSQIQLNKKIIYNSRYKEDTNIFSMKLALEEINKNETVIIIEADIYLDDLALKQIYFESKKDKSLWFTCGKYKKNQYGGILKTGKNNQVEEIKIIDHYMNKYSDYFKLLGITTIGKNELEKYSQLLNQYANKTIKQYYLVPWIENLNKLFCYGYDIDKNLVTSFNTKAEYQRFIENLKKRKKYLSNYKLIKINKLYPIENFIEKRKIIIRNKIIKEGYWTKPIIADKENNLIMDGHHRYQAAKDIGFDRVPVIQVDYRDIIIWSLKESEIVSKELVKEKALSSNIYPNKTVKHKFYFEVKECKIPLYELSR